MSWIWTPLGLEGRKPSSSEPMTGGSANETDDADVAELVVRGGVAQSLSSTETRLEDADASEVVREGRRDDDAPSEDEECMGEGDVAGLRWALL